MDEILVSCFCDTDRPAAADKDGVGSLSSWQGAPCTS